MSALSRREFCHINPERAATPAPPPDPTPSLLSRLRSMIPRRAARSERAPVLVMPAPARNMSTVEAEASELANLLSPSQVKTFLDCQVRWWAKYGLNLPEKRGSALGLGSAFHVAIAENFKQKITSRKDMAAETVEGLFRAEWLSQLENEGVELTEGEDSDDFENMGSAMVASYMENVAPLIQPAAVELPVRGEIGGVQVQGKIDVLTEDGTIIDAKTASKRPPCVQPDYRFQVATYVQLCPQACGTARVDTVTKTKTIAIHQATVAIGEMDRLQTARIYPLAQEAMRSGLYLPNRSSNLCSRKYCSFWKWCEGEYGGNVDKS